MLESFPLPLHNLEDAALTALAAVGVFFGASFVFKDGRNSRTGFMIIGLTMAVVLFLMIAVERVIDTSHLSPLGLLTPRP